MSAKTFSSVTTVVFSLIAILHVLRLVYGWEAVIAGWVVPLWVSIIGVIVAAYLAYTSFKLGK